MEISGACLRSLMESYQTVDRIMACGTGKSEEKRKIQLKFWIVVVQVVKGIAENVLIQVRIPAEGCIRVRIMAEAIGMSMNAGTIPRDNKILLRDQAFGDRRVHGGCQKDVLEHSFKIEDDIPTGFKP